MGRLSPPRSKPALLAEKELREVEVDAVDFFPVGLLCPHQPVDQDSLLTDEDPPVQGRQQQHPTECDASSAGGCCDREWGPDWVLVVTRSDGDRQRDEHTKG